MYVNAASIPVDHPAGRRLHELARQLCAAPGVQLSPEEYESALAAAVTTDAGAQLPRQLPAPFTTFRDSAFVRRQAGGPAPSLPPSLPSLPTTMVHRPPTDQPALAAISQPAPEKPTMTHQLDQNPLTTFEAKIKAFAAANNIQGSIYGAAYSRFLATKEGKAAKAAYDSTRAYSTLAPGGAR